MKKILLIAAIAALGMSTAACGVFPSYRIMQAKGDGEAELSRANAAKQVAVQTAKAKSEAAGYEKQAEITRAEGAAAAIKITGDALQNHPEYLRYLYVNNLADSKGQIIYIPTEAGLPILEAGRGQTHHLQVEGEK